MSVIPPGPFPDDDWWADDPALRAFLQVHVDAATLKGVEARLAALGKDAPARLDALAREADRKRPVLRGDRPRDVVFDASYEALRRAAREHEVFTLSWKPGGPGAPRPLGFALAYLFAQAESGYSCPGCMTDGAAYVLARHAPAPHRDRWVGDLATRAEGAMYMTEREGGSDLGAATATAAEPATDGTWRLTGEKWFASNCTAEYALALARPAGATAEGTAGLGLFLVPRDLDDGTANPGLAIRRLKDKLGVASMPTGEVVLDRAVAHLVAPPPGGFKAMAEMVNVSRIYNAFASVAVARRALREAARAGRLRSAFGRPLREQPLFARAAFALALETEAALAASLDVAALLERGEEPLLRLLTPPVKAGTARLAVRAASEACELLGGVGYTEEYVTPRLLRDAQVLPIWEGTTNVQALEFRKSLAREGALDALAAHVRGLAESRTDPRLLPAVEAVGRALTGLRKEAGAHEAAAARLLDAAFRVHAAAAFLRGAATEGSPRMLRAAASYAAWALPSDRAEGERALERSVAKGEPALVVWP